VEGLVPRKTPTPGSTVTALVEAYRAEKMPRRVTRQGTTRGLNEYVVPVWGPRSIQELQARPVDLWLRSLALSPKSKVHIRGMIRLLWDFAMWRGDYPFSETRWFPKRLHPSVHDAILAVARRDGIRPKCTHDALTAEQAIHLVSEQVGVGIVTKP
jgi:hypothetical protein